MKLNAFLTETFKKAGFDFEKVAAENKDFANLLASTVEIPDDAMTGINSLMSVDAAKSSDVIKSHYFAMFGDTTDKVLKDVLDAHPELLEGALADKFKGTQKSFDKIRLLSEGIKAIKDKKLPKPEENEQIKALRTELQSLHEKSGNLIKEHEKALADKDAHYNNILTDRDFTQTLLSKNLAYRNKDNKNAELVGIKAILNAELAKFNEGKGLKLISNNNGISLVRADNGEAPYDEKHNLITLDGWLNQTLSSNNLLEVNPPPPPPPGGGGGGGAPATVPANSAFFAAQAEA